MFIASRLQELGHEVRVYASNAAFAALGPKLPTVTEIPGLVLEYQDNRVKVGRSFRVNRRIWRDRQPVIRRLESELCAYRPHLVITDFEPFLPAAARESGFEFISVDHQHVIPGLRLNPPLKHWPHYLATLAVVYWTHRGESANLVTSFFHPKKPAQSNYHYFAPILRKEIVSAQPERGRYVLVYQTSSSFSRLPELLQQVPIDFRVYAFPREGQAGNCTFKPRNHSDFLADLTNCGWVLTNGGYTLMSEALALGKPVLSVPVEGQFEQWINSFHLQKLGYGEMFASSELSSARILQFAERQNRYSANLATKRFNGNDEILAKILSFL
jgi:uncharacterized protein (TIGR00661 family)